MKQELDISFGAFESPNDQRDYKLDSYTLTGELEVVHKKEYLPTDVLHQRKIGKCTASAFIQLANKKFGMKFSDDFHYLMQKKLVDKNWTEGSTVANAPYVAVKYGMLPQEYFASITDSEPNITYEEYIARLQKVTDEEFYRLLAVASKYKIKGYARVDHTDKVAVAVALSRSEVGLLTRYEVTSDWFTDVKGNITWLYSLISPLRNNKKVISGHAIGNTGYDIKDGAIYTLTNTWSSAYGNNGSVEANNAVVEMKEAWFIYWDSPVPDDNKPVSYVFNKDIRYGETSTDVKMLQTLLVKKGLLANNLITSYYGDITRDAVIKYQRSKGMFGTSGRVVGYFTRMLLNKEK